MFHTQKTKTGVRIALVDVTRDAVAALTLRPGGYYFWSGRNPQTCAIGVGLTFRKVGKRAGVAGVRPHRLRHTFAVTLLAAGADIRLVSRLFGHRSIRATERHYNPWIKVFQDQADAAVFAAERYAIERRHTGKPADCDFQPMQ